MLSPSKRLSGELSERGPILTVSVETPKSIKDESPEGDPVLSATT